MWRERIVLQTLVCGNEEASTTMAPVNSMQGSHHALLLLFFKFKFILKITLKTTKGVSEIDIKSKTLLLLLLLLLYIIINKYL